jgi:hypothetical protein
MTKTTTKKQPSAQVEPAQKASALKVANEAKRAQPDWLRRGSQGSKSRWGSSRGS